MKYVASLRIFLFLHEFRKVFRNKYCSLDKVGFTDYEDAHKFKSTSFDIIRPWVCELQIPGSGPLEFL